VILYIKLSDDTELEQKP